MFYFSRLIGIMFLRVYCFENARLCVNETYCDAIKFNIVYKTNNV